MPPTGMGVECSGGRDLGGVAMSGSLLTFFPATGDRPPEVAVPMPRSGSSRRGWLVTSYAGAAAFFALEAVARRRAEPGDLCATVIDLTWSRPHVGRATITAAPCGVMPDDHVPDERASTCSGKGYAVCSEELGKCAGWH